jgi:hypothetical protein
MTNRSAMVQLVTWNDFGEGTIIEPTQDYGLRDLGIVQNLRRQYLDSAFPFGTNDLALALRFYNLRVQYTNSAPISAELDRVFSNIVAGATATATRQMTGIESNRLVIYNLSHTTGQLQFLVGGYVASTMQVQMSTDLNNWQTVQTFAAGTNISLFSTNTTQVPCMFFRVQ